MSSEARRALARFAYGAVERGWTAGHRVARAARPPRAAAWATPGGQGILVVAPHPDDETVGAGGVIRLHADAGDQVTVVVVTDGSASRALPIPPAEMAAARAAEVTTAANLLGVHRLVQLALPERTWSNDAVADALAPLLAEAAVVYAPSAVDFHPDHLRLAHLIGRLVSDHHVIRAMELGVPLTSVLVNLLADITPAEHAKARALAEFRTQAGALIPLRRMAAYRAARFGVPAEVFWNLSGRAWREVHEHGATASFRGIRVRPFTDPLSWQRGWSERRRVAQVARSAAREPAGTVAG
jgi:LmbE family N-acetylglucosaminyl deacetylase